MNGNSAIEFLDQTEYWRDGKGQVKRLRDLDDDHIVNLKGWLLRYAPRMLSMEISAAYSFASTLNGEMAIDAMDYEIAALEEANPFLWMEDKPLLREINRIIYERLEAQRR